jgi:Fe-Mn family superoxide dismutase
MLFVSFVATLLSASLSLADCSDKTAYAGTDSVHPFELEDLPYAEDFLGTFVSEDTVIAHYEHHHQAYIDKLNAFIAENDVYEGMTLVELNHVANGEEGLVKYAGGAYNHYMYWQVLTNPNCTKDEPEGLLAEGILESWDTVADFITEFNTTLGKVFGSGWVWGCVNNYNEILIVTTPNQENPLMGINGDVCFPFLGVDAWEHAYYLDYKWARQSYYNGFFGAIDWDLVEYFYETYSYQLYAVPF